MDVEIDLNEDSSGEEGVSAAGHDAGDSDDDAEFSSDDADSQGFVDLSEMLGAGSSDDDEGPPPVQHAQIEPAGGSDDDDDDDDDDALAQLGSFVTSISSGPRRPEDPPRPSKHKRHLLRDHGEDGRTEGDFGAPLNRGASS